MIIGVEAMKHLKSSTPQSESEMTWMTETSEQPIIAVDRLPIDYDRLKPYLERGVKLYIEAGPTGKLLKHPVSISLRPGISLREFDVVNYIATSLAGYCSRLIPWAVGSRAVRKLAAYLRRYRTSSPSSLSMYIMRLRQFCDWSGYTPENLISQALNPDGSINPRGVKRIRDLMEEYVGELTARGRAPSTIAVSIACIRTFLKVNGVQVPKIPLPPMRVVYEDRAPRPEELWKMIQVADLRGKVIVSMLALGGFRVGTLCRLRYYHVKEDLERGIIPVHIHVESEITKGKYGDYDTFIGREAVEYLKLYLDARRRGSPSGKIPPEEIDDDSPLIRADKRRVPRPITRRHMSSIIRQLYIKAGLAREKRGHLYVLRPHSIRKFFRTQLAALGVPADYIEYMMGHKVSTYHDIKMKGIEFLRNVYTAAGLSIRPKTRLSRLEMLKEIIRAWGLDPEKILVKEALLEPHRIVVANQEEEHIKTLSKALREMLRRELLDAQR